MFKNLCKDGRHLKKLHTITTTELLNRKLIINSLQEFVRKLELSQNIKYS